MLNSGVQIVFSFGLKLRGNGSYRRMATSVARALGAVGDMLLILPCGMASTMQALKDLADT